MRNFIIVTAVFALALTGLTACGEAKEKTIEGLMSQLKKVDLGSLQKMADGATGDIKAQVAPLLEQLKTKKEMAMSAIEALKGDGKWTELLQKAKDSLGDVTKLYDKIKGMLGK